MTIKKFAEETKGDSPRNPVAGGGGPPYDEAMEARIAQLEEVAKEVRAELRSIDVRLGSIETKLNVFETRLDGTATKADLQRCVNSLIKWIVATSAVLGAAAITVLTFVLNNAVPKANPATPPPIVITVPVQPSAPATLPAK